jgi:perosamine synthetase
MKIPLSDITFLGNESAYCKEALDSRWISGAGPYLTRFEELIAGKIQRRHAICVTNGTMALELALRAMDIGVGDEVIVPSLTFAAPAASVLAVGATPVLVDVTAESWTIDPAAVEKAIGSRTKAIITVDVLGHPCDYDRLLKLGIPIIEDAAEAHGALYKGRPVGSFGLVSTFSFHANKTITTGEGGCVATDDDALNKKMRLIANHGMNPAKPYWHEVTGRNFRMTNLTAAIGCGQAEHWDELVAARNTAAATYDRTLIGAPIERRPVASWAKEACWLYTVHSPRRSELLSALRAEGIDARAIWHVLPDNPSLAGARVLDHSVARSITDEAFWLPTWANMPSEMIDHVSSVLVKTLNAVDLQ